ncbi:MAG: AsmA-like C-terminal region-containing protein [Alphaproteobacteria bacterium]
MRKWYIAGALLLVFGAAVVVALFNLNRLIKQNREFLLAQAEQALGRNITAGDFELSIFYGIGLKVKNFALADDPAFSSGDFVRAKSLQINVRLWPLLRKRFEIKNVILRDPVIRIARNARGDFNFSSIGKREKPKEAKAHETRKRGEKSGPPGVAVYLANITNGEVIYRDQKEGADLDLKQVDLTLKQGSGNKPVSVELKAALFSPRRNLRLETNVGPITTGVDMSRVRLVGTAEIDPLDVSALQAAVPKVKSLLPRELQLSGILAISKVKFNGTMENLALNGTLEGTRATIGVGKYFNKAASVPMEFTGNAQYANDTIYLRNADLKLNTLTISSKGEVHLGDETTVNVALEAKPSSLAGWGNIVPAVAPYELSGTAEIHATLRGSIGKGGVPDVQGTLTLAGASIKPPHWATPVKNLNSRITFSGQKASTQRASFDLGSSKVRFAATVEKFSPLTLSYAASTPELRPAEFEPSVTEERKGDVFRKLSSTGHLRLMGGNVMFEGKLASSDGSVRKIAFQRLDAAVAVADKTARVQSLRMDALGGSVTGTGEYAFGESVPHFSMETKIQRIDIHEFYRTLKERTQRDLQGRLNANAKVAGSGKNWDEIKPNLRGQGDAEIIDGALLNINLANAALSASGIPGLGNLVTPQMRKKYPETFEAKDTRFKEMKALFDIADGRINVRDVRVIAADYSMQGEGWATFERRINFHTQLVLSPPLSADLTQSVREARLLFNKDNEFTMPFTVSGTLPKVKAKPDSSYLAKMFQRGKARQLTEELERQFFGSKESTAPKDGDTSEPEPTQKRKKRQSTEDMIRKGLEGLFRR